MGSLGSELGLRGLGASCDWSQTGPASASRWTGSSAVGSLGSELGLRGLGASCNWSRERFTLDEQLSGVGFRVLTRVKG